MQPKKKDKLFTMDPKEITYEMVAKKLREIVAARGRRGTDKHESVEMLAYLANVSRGAAQRFEVLAQLVSSLFDLSPSVSGHMKIPTWRSCVRHVLDMMQILADNANVTVDDTVELASPEAAAEEPAADAPVKVWGNLVAFVERLDDEMFKSLQFIDPHTHEYTARLKDEPVFLALAQKVRRDGKAAAGVVAWPRHSLFLSALSVTPWCCRTLVILLLAFMKLLICCVACTDTSWHRTRAPDCSPVILQRTP